MKVHVLLAAHHRDAQLGAALRFWIGIGEWAEVVERARRL